MVVFIRPLQQSMLTILMVMVVFITSWTRKIEAQYSLRPFNPEVFPELPEAYHNDPVELPPDLDSLLEKALSLPVGNVELERVSYLDCCILTFLSY